ncbi:MAG: hypothetical protein WCJ61_11060 [Paludibacter sp.]
MKKKKEAYDDKTDQIVKKIMFLFKNYQLEEETKLVAICENENPVNFELAQICNNQKAVTLGEGFDKLTTYDKLLVAKTTIHTYLQLTQGEIPVYGRILYFELRDDSPTYRAFDLNGEYISIFK